MLKIIGASFVLFACTMIAMQKLAREREKNNVLREFRQLLIYLSEKMEYTQDTLLSLLRQAQQENFGEVSEFLELLTGKLSEGSGQTLRQAWETSLRECADSLQLTAPVRRILRNVGNSLGQLTLQVEVENLNRACAELQTELERGERELSGNAKLIRSTGILFGILLVILFV